MDVRTTVMKFLMRLFFLKKRTSVTSVRSVKPVYGSGWIHLVVLVVLWAQVYKNCLTAEIIPSSKIREDAVGEAPSYWQMEIEGHRLQTEAVVDTWLQKKSTEPVPDSRNCSTPSSTSSRSGSGSRGWVGQTKRGRRILGGSRCQMLRTDL